jgi:YfiH family protein
MTLQWITPDWPAPPNVRAASTLRTGGVSTGSFASLNLASHVRDELAAVEENRRRLRTALVLPSEPAWLNQVHGSDVVDAASQLVTPTADAVFTRVSGPVCAILTADCLPVLLCDRAGTRVAAAHAGWRGLAGGVLTSTVTALDISADRLIAWLGPAIEQAAFEVGPEVREQFIARDAGHASAFVANARGRWQADLYALARRELANIGILDVHGGDCCCYSDAARFFSYRRDRQTGRMATLAWLAP